MAPNGHGTAIGAVDPLPRITVSCTWASLFLDRGRHSVEAVLPPFLLSRRWFGGKARRMRRTEIVDAVPLPAGRGLAFLALVRVSYAKGAPDLYVLPLALATARRASTMLDAERHRIVARVELEAGAGVLHEAMGNAEFGRALLQTVAKRRVFRGRAGAIAGLRARAFAGLRGRTRLEPAPLGAEQSNTSLVFGDRLILKLFRRVEPGVNPDLEIGRFLTERTGFAHVPAVAGSIEYRPRRGEAISIAIVQQSVRNEGDAWRFTLDALDRYYRRVRHRPPPPVSPRQSLVGLAGRPMPREAQDAIADYLGDARLLGRRTAELHLALAADRDDQAFAPEALTPSYRRALSRGMVAVTKRNFTLLLGRLGALPRRVGRLAVSVAARRTEVLQRARAIAARSATALRTRVHGDYHLGQVLRCGGDFVIIDFEGEPAVPLSTRRAKHCPLKDVAGMIRSFHYAAQHGLRGAVQRDAARPGPTTVLSAWAEAWYTWVAAAFLRSYLDTAAGAAFLPRDERELDDLLTFHLLEKAVYELGYELNNRPEWVYLPLAGIRDLLDAGRPGSPRGRKTTREMLT